MKKLLTVTLGLALAFACVTPTFAQDAPKKEKKSKGSKKKTKKGDKKG